MKKLKKQAWTSMPMPYDIITRLEYLAARDRRSRRSGRRRFCNRNHERFSDGTEGYDEEPLTEQEVVHPDGTDELLGMDMVCEKTVLAVQKAHTDNPASV